MSEIAYFEEANMDLRGGMLDPYGGIVKDLPVWRGQGQIVSCWKMTVKERLSAILFGRVWIRVATPKTHPPIAVEVSKTVFG